MTEITVTSPKEIVERLNRLVVEFPVQVKDAVWLELQIVMNESKKLCPFETGALRGSGHVPEPESVDGHLRATLGYSQGYAWWVHELIDNYHKPPTQAKYLEQPLRGALPGLTEKIVERAVYLIESGTTTKDVKQMIEQMGGKT